MANTYVYDENRKFEEFKKLNSSDNLGQRSVFGELDKTKEYAVLWLCDDETTRIEQCNLSTMKLRGIIDYSRTIPDINTLQEIDDQNMFLITDVALTEKDYIRLTALKQVRLIYVYEKSDNLEKRRKTDLSAQYTKVRGPFYDFNQLVNTLSTDIRSMIRQPDLASELPPLTSVSKIIERSTSAAYSYVTDWYIYLIRALQEVPPSRTCKDRFIEECNKLYESSPTVLQAIQEFKNTYVSEDVIRWYTRDGFVYKVLNKVLREQNQEGLQLLHFLIYDLDQQLKREFTVKAQNWMKNDIVRLYRGQLMSQTELQQLLKNKGEAHFINSFLSTTTDLEVAKMFSGAGAFNIDDNTQAVIFHIEWADFTPKQGVADIRHLSFNGDEGEILLSPIHTLNLLGCVYDTKERVWNVTFSRLQQTDDPLIRIHDDECLMRLELALRYLVEVDQSLENDADDELDSSADSHKNNFRFSSKYCATFVEDVQVLLHELVLPTLCSISLNENDAGRFELKTLRSFTSDLFNHGPEIQDEMVVILYDALGGIFKTKGKLMEAYHYYQKASLYDQPHTQTSYTRQAHLAQIQKISGNYELTCKIFHELTDQTHDTDTFLFEDIAFARSKDMDNVAFLQNSYDFLEFCCAKDDDDDDDDDADDDELISGDTMSMVSSAWGELGYKYFYQNQNVEKALICYTREKDLFLAESGSRSSNFNPLIGSNSERIGDIYAFKNDVDQALVFYEEALHMSMQETFVSDVIATARCMCKIGLYSCIHEPKTFYRAFQYLILGYSKPYARDTIGKCYMYLSRSLRRIQQYERVMRYAKQALSVFLHDPLLLERLIDECCQYIVEIHRSINDNNASIPTEADILKDRVPFTDEQIKEMLQFTQNELKSEMDSVLISTSS